MAETINIAEVANRISGDIVSHFRWQTHPKRDDNFNCVNEKHMSDSGEPKRTHPCDVVFSYQDPYLQKCVYLLTDLKSYADDSITPGMLKGALKSLCMSTECANQSGQWREKYSVDVTEPHEVRGLLFVHNYTKGYERSFHDAIAKVNRQRLPIAIGILLHFLGPRDIARLYSIGNDIIRLTHSGDLPHDYSFYYPDLMLVRRQGDVWDQPATIEALTGPYVLIKHKKAKASSKGYVIYHNRGGSRPEAWEYFLDSLSRYQMLESGERIRVRCTHPDLPNDFKSIFETAKQRYARAWGFDSAREKILEKIEIDRITAVSDTYNPGTTGWRE